jgi:oxygen-independent coproporphyrinogen-3 oxidase
MSSQASKTTTEQPFDRATIHRLIAKHDRPGPRYTSYPTALEFAESIGREAYEASLTEANRSGEGPISIYMHLPFCEKRCQFCGCHAIVTNHRGRTKSYLDLIGKEAEMVAQRLPRRREFAQLHLGGGTPTFYSPDELRALISSLLVHYEPTPTAELAIEIDPRVTTNAHIDALADVGFNRISMGVQDFTPAVQERIHRIQTVRQTEDLVRHAQHRGYRGINADLIYGLPLQTLEGFENTLNRVIDMGVDRAAVYSFAYVPWMRPHQRKIDADELPSQDIKMQLFALARERFLAAGYEPIGMDHFALPDDELSRAKREGRLRRNFQGYSVVRTDDVVAFGVSAISDVRGVMVQNEKKLSRYSNAIVEGRLPTAGGIRRTRDDTIRADVIGQLMCNFFIDMPVVEKRWNIDFRKYFIEELDALAVYEGEGLVDIGDAQVRASAVGELFVRNLAMCFDRYLRERQSAAKTPVFSRTV